jgi:hypothetical protein
MKCVFEVQRAAMIHKPLEYEWMEEGLKSSYEEFSDNKFWSSSWNEDYKVVKYVH